MNQHLTLPSNGIGMDYFIGDLHGKYDLLMAELEAVHFDKDKDRLIAVGDLIDRGEDSLKCLSLLDEPWFFSVMGNHEHIMRAIFCPPEYHARDDEEEIKELWYKHGGSWFERSPLNKDRQSLAIVIDKINALPLTMEVDGVGVVHACPPRDWAMTKLPELAGDMSFFYHLVENRDLFNSLATPWIKNIDCVVVGHSVVDYGYECRGNIFYLDTGAYHHNANDFTTNKKLTLTSIDKLKREIRMKKLFNPAAWLR